jgi:hypothetical protein
MWSFLVWLANVATVFSLAVSIFSAIVGVLSYLYPNPPTLVLILRKWLPILAIVLFSFWLGAWVVKNAALDAFVEKDVTVHARDYLPTSTNIFVSSGDTVEIALRNSSNITWSCFDNKYIDPAGFSGKDPVQESLVNPNAHMCELIGQIGNGQYIEVGKEMRFEAENTGVLELMVNDVELDKCVIKGDPRQCYTDNVGELDLKVIVKRK